MKSIKMIIGLLTLILGVVTATNAADTAETKGSKVKLVDKANGKLTNLSDSLVKFEKRINLEKQQKQEQARTEKREARRRKTVDGLREEMERREARKNATTSPTAKLEKEDK